MNNLRWNFIYSFILSHRVLVAWFEFVFFLMWSVKEVFKQRLFCLKQTKAAVFPSSRRRCLKLLEQTAADSVQWEERERCLMTLSTQFSHLQRKKGHSEEISHRVVYLRTCITMFLGYSLTLSPQFKTQNIHQALPNTDSFIHWFIDWFRCASLQTLEGWRHRMVFFSWVFSSEVGKAAAVRRVPLLEEREAKNPAEFFWFFFCGYGTTFLYITVF